MKSAEHYLNLAKEKVAKKEGYDAWGELVQMYEDVDPDGWVRILNAVAECCLSLQQEDAEKYFLEQMRLLNKESLQDFFKENERLKAEIDHWKLENNSLQAELSQAMEEKAKAFDEGANAQLEALVNFDKDARIHPVNPYKQDTQPKDK